MESPPQTPSHSRHTSNISYPTPNGYESSPRRNSRASPETPHRHSFNHSDSIGIDVFSSGGVTPGAGLGLGNLADELAEAWSDDEMEGEDDEPDMNFQEAGEGGGGTTRDSGVDVSPLPPPKPASLSPPLGFKGHRRKTSEYDGSDYGGDSDLESPGILPGLQSKMDLVESLARRGTETTGTERDGVVGRVVEGLKDLGSQSGVEGGATR